MNNLQWNNNQKGCDHDLLHLSVVSHGCDICIFYSNAPIIVDIEYHRNFCLAYLNFCSNKYYLKSYKWFFFFFDQLGNFLFSYIDDIVIYFKISRSI